MEPESIALFRFGEQCNNDCPMCSNTGQAGLFFHATEELLRRATFLGESGFRRVVVTGGEPTIHPGFWAVIERLAHHDILWDVNSHGRRFCDLEVCRKAVSLGLQRAIISLHSHLPEVSAALFGTRVVAHDETVAGIESLRREGVAVMLNCVLTQLNLEHVTDYLRDCRARFGPGISYKFVFPSTLGKGGAWEAIQLRYRDIRRTVRDLRKVGQELDIEVRFESIPNCVLGDPLSRNFGRSGFGESHYLDDADGSRVYSIRHIEAELSAFGEGCRECLALPGCSGVSLKYAERYGLEELEPYCGSPLS